MKCLLDADHGLIFTPLFPASFGPSSKRYQALIGVGGNLGATKRRLDKLIARLKNDPYIDPIQSGPLLLNPDFSNASNPLFINTVILIATSLSPKRLLSHLLYLEYRFGRVRPYKNAPRTLDLDIIFFESKKLYNESLQIPHPHWFKRPSVVVPMLWLKAPG